MNRRRVLIGASLVLAGCASAMPVQDYELSAVFETPGKSKDEIFKATKVWIAENFRSAKSVIEYESQADGTLIGNGVIPYPCRGLECVGKSNWSVPFTMRSDMKDGRFRLEFSNVRLRWPPTMTYPGRDGPVNTQGDWDAIKGALLDLGPALSLAIARKPREF